MPVLRESTTSRGLGHACEKVERDFELAMNSKQSHSPGNSCKTPSRARGTKQFAAIIRNKGSKYLMQTCLNWIAALGCASLEWKRDREASTIDVRNALAASCKTTTLIPFGSPKQIKGSQGLAERDHLNVERQMRTLRLHEMKTSVELSFSHRTCCPHDYVDMQDGLSRGVSRNETARQHGLGCEEIVACLVQSSHR